MLSLAEARALIRERIHPLPAAPTPLDIAGGRILRQEIVAPEDQPAFDRSAMDGYAVGADDRSERFRVVLEVQPGAIPERKIGPGEAARIFTGAQIPEGASQVIMQEDVERDGDWMIPRARDQKTWIRRRGEDARQGDRLLAAGNRLGPGELSLLAQVGVVTPEVTRMPLILHITTGNELVDASLAPGPGQIRDSNSALVRGLVTSAHALIADQSRCRDGRDLLAREVEMHHLHPWNLLLISGGASVGDYDFGTHALQALGFDVHFRQINVRPGKPLVFATKGRQAAFVIPGNPVSHFVSFQVAIRLAIECLEGAPDSWSLARLPLTEDLITKSDARETMWPARVTIEQGELRVRPLTWQSSGDVRGLVSANALVPISPGATGARKGEPVDCLLLGAIA